ncbi:MAG: hypothetical protein IPM91_04905 [Bacteroidetes bacterium]|nr:hypothetical protein [Bacteroidota bacterium]
MVFAFLSITSFVNAQSADFSKVDSLMALHQYEDASLECEYILYQQPGNPALMAECLLKKTDCLKATGKHAEVPVLLSRLDGFSGSDSLKSRIYFQKALGYYMSDKFELAEKSILPLFNLQEVEEEIEVTGALLYAMALGESGKWMEAKLFLTNFIQSNPRTDAALKTELTEQVNMVYDKENIPKLRSIKKAKTLSLLFPGLGQAYNGNFGKGFVSLLLVSGSGAWVGWNIFNTTYITAATAGVYIFLYFYFGGANQSSWLVPVKNHKKKLSTINRCDQN